MPKKNGRCVYKKLTVIRKLLIAHWQNDDANKFVQEGNVKNGLKMNKYIQNKLAPTATNIALKTYLSSHILRTYIFIFSFLSFYGYNLLYKIFLFKFFFVHVFFLFLLCINTYMYEYIGNEKVFTAISTLI